MESSGGGGGWRLSFASAPAGFRDWVPKELQRVGCVELLNTVQKRVRPKLHAFGHIHEGTARIFDLCLSVWGSQSEPSSSDLPRHFLVIQPTTVGDD